MVICRNAFHTSEGAGKRPEPIVCVSVVSTYHAMNSMTNVATPTRRRRSARQRLTCERRWALPPLPAGGERGGLRGAPFATDRRTLVGRTSVGAIRECLELRIGVDHLHVFVGDECVRCRRLGKGTVRL